MIHDDTAGDEVLDLLVLLLRQIRRATQFFGQTYLFIKFERILTDRLLEQPPCSQLNILLVVTETSETFECHRHIDTLHKVRAIEITQVAVYFREPDRRNPSFKRNRPKMLNVHQNLC